MTPSRPRGRNLRWAITAAITALTFTAYLDRGNLSVAAPQIMQDLNFSNTAMGLVLSAFVWPYALMNLPSGWAVDRFGPRFILALASFVWSICAIFTGFARGLWTLIGLRALLGISEAPLFAGALKATNIWFPAHEKALATSIYISATQLGLAVAPPLATILLLAMGWQVMFVILGLFGFAAFAGWLVIYRDPELHRKLSSAERDYIFAGRGKAIDAERLTGREWFQLFRCGSIWIIIAGAFCLQYVFWFYISWMPSYLERAHGYTLLNAGWVSALPYMAGAVAVILGGRISDSLILRGVDSLAARRYTVAAGGLLTALAMIATALSTNPTMAAILLVAGMFAYSLASAPYWALASDIVCTPKAVASVGSIQNFGGFLGGAFSPIVTGMLIDRFDGFVVAVATAGMMALISAALYGLALRRRVPL